MVSVGDPAGTLRRSHTPTHLMETPLHKVSMPSAMWSQKMPWFSAIDYCIELISLKFCETFILTHTHLYLIKQANVEVSGS